jgi:protein-S-isoprenylcysteine O-methyltransferase Ste14
MTQVKMERRDNAGLLMPPPVYPGLGLVLAFALERLSPIWFLNEGRGWQFWLGLALGVGALALGIAAAREFQRAGTHVNPHLPSLSVVTTGPFTYMRNPMYVGFVVLQAGVSLVLSLEWGLLLLPLVWLTLHFMVVTREERYLGAKFGDIYDKYRARTRRWGLF